MACWFSPSFARPKGREGRVRVVGHADRCRSSASVKTPGAPSHNIVVVSACIIRNKLRILSICSTDVQDSPFALCRAPSSRT